MTFVQQLKEVFGARRPTKWVLLVLLALALSGLEVLGASLIYLLVSHVTEPSARLELPLVGDPTQYLPALPEEQVVYLLTAAICAFFVMRAVFLVLQKYAQARVVNNACAEVSAQLVRGYFRMPYTLHLQRNSAELVRNAFFNVASLANLLGSAVKLMAEALVVIGLVIAMLLLAPLVTVVAVLVLGPTLMLMLRMVRSRMKAYGRGVKEAEKHGLAIVQQGLTGIRDVRILGVEGFFSSAYRKTRTVQAGYRTRYAAVGELPRVLIETLLILTIVGFFAFVTASPLADTNMFSLLGLFAYVGMRLKPSIQGIVTHVNTVRHHMPSLEDVAVDLQTMSALASSSLPAASGEVPKLEGMIELDDVEYCYDGSQDPALTGINLRIARGESIGIVGPTGAGKTTLVDVIAGLLVPTSGTIVVDGVDIHSDVRSWYRQLGVVSQSVFIMDATVRENIALGVRPEKVDEEALREAVRLAQLADVVGSLPAGLETRLGERGTRLSGGQRQRIAIARALYRRSEILIFDEGTAALDNQTEAELVEALEGLRGERTLIFVAHRLSTVRHCDRVLVVEGARITDIGSFDEMVRTHPLFASVRATQSIR